MATPPTRASGILRCGCLTSPAKGDDVAPSVVGPQSGDQRDHEAGQASACSGKGGGEVVPRAVGACRAEAEACDDDDQRAFEPGQNQLHVGGVACAENIEAGDEPGHREGEDLSPEKMCKGRLIEGAEDREGCQYARQSRRDGCERGGLGYRDLGPHIEEAGQVAIGIAQKGVLAAVLRPSGGDLCVGHRAEQGEQPACDPHRIDHAGRADGGHHLSRHEKDAAADDDAHNDRHGVRCVEDAR